MRVQSASFERHRYVSTAYWKARKDAYTATQLAKDIDAAAEDHERTVLLRKAMLSDEVFAQLFDTFHGDLVTKAKLKQRAQALKVHPDLSEECTDYFVQSAETAELGVLEGDGIRLIASTDVAIPTPVTDQTEADQHQLSASGGNPGPDKVGEEKPDQTTAKPPSTATDVGISPLPRPRTAADVNVSLTVDSSLDGDKLEKQLAALRRYGLI
jgi:hypothetical protein